MKTQLVLFDQPNITVAIILKWLDLFISKNHLLRSQRFSAKLNLGFHIISIAKTTSKKIGALICSMTFLSPEVALHLFKSIIWPYMKYLCHVWAGAYNCWSFTCCLSWTLDSSTKCNSSLLYRFPFGRYSSELAELIHLLTLMEGLLVIQIDSIIFLLPFLGITKIPWC